MQKHSLLFLFLISTFYQAIAQQTIGGWKDEKALYAETKQVNQFFRRFNNEEAVDGTRLYNNKDSSYRDPKNRVKYLKMLFDNENPSISKDIKNNFISEVNSKNKPQFLDFHGGKWFAEVKTSFLYQNQQHPLTLFLQLQNARVGSKWVITDLIFSPYSNIYKKDTNDAEYFLHPLSHEVDFMNMHKIFENNAKHIYQYTSNNFTIDPMTLFCEDVKSGKLKFQTVNKVILHFFQIEGWYFELTEFNRSGNNTGWLISSITKANEKEKIKIEQFIKSKND